MENTIINISNNFAGGSGRYVNPFGTKQKEREEDVFEDSRTYDGYDEALSIIYERIDNQTLGQVIRGFIEDMATPVRRLLAA